MLSFLIAVAAGLVCGVLSGFGIGGGSLLMVWMTAVLSMEQKAAQGINLLYFLPTAAAALIFHTKNRLIEWKAVAPPPFYEIRKSGLFCPRIWKCRFCGSFSAAF